MRAQYLNRPTRLCFAKISKQVFFYDRTLLKIIELQIKARDFGAARKSISDCTYKYGKNSASIQLAKPFAASGQLENASDVLRELGTDHGWRQDMINDGVQMCWIEFLIDTNKLDDAQKAIIGLKRSDSLSEGLTKLALAHATSPVEGKAISNRLWKDATTAATKISYEFDHAKALWEIADTQIEAGENDAAAATIDSLVETALTFKDGWTRICALREAGVRAARMKDKKAAKNLFKQAIQSRETIDESKQTNALKFIAKAQVSVGLSDDALNTAALIKHSENDFTQDGLREEVLCDIAVEQAKGGKMAEAIATTLTIEHFIQFQNDAFLAIVEECIRNGDNELALTTAGKIANPTRKATARLKIATAYAANGDKEKAKEIAGEIQLEIADNIIFLSEEIISFDFEKADTWGCLYDQRGYYTGLSMSVTLNRAVECSAAAMELTQVLNEPTEENYADSFKELDEQVIRSLARAHAIHGDEQKALEWANRIGSDKKAEDNFEEQNAVMQRVNALVGVAEGMLEKQAKQTLSKKK